MEETLKLFNLTDNEIKIYLSLLKTGETTATVLRKNTKIANSQVYIALDNLLDKGMITHKLVPKGKLYSALDPEILKKLMEEKLKRVEKKIPYLKKLRNHTKKETHTEVYEGYNGFKNALLKLVTDCPKGEELKIIGFSNNTYKQQRFIHLFQDINKISKQKKHKLKLILDNRENKYFEWHQKMGITQIKFMEKGFSSPAAIDIFGDWVYIFLWGETPYAFVLKNEEIAKGFKSYFNFLWNIAED